MREIKGRAANERSDAETAGVLLAKLVGRWKARRLGERFGETRVGREVERFNAVERFRYFSPREPVRQDVDRAEKERIAGAKSGLAINPIHLDEDLTLVDAITAIDGAVLMDTECVCGCIGAILDGDLVTKGALARGSRYNSARNYIMRRRDFDEHFLAVVMSEDGTVDAINEDKVYRLHMAQD